MFLSEWFSPRYRTVGRCGRAPVILLFLGMTTASLALLSMAATADAGPIGSNPICGRIGHTMGASSGAHMYCFGAQPNGPTIRFATPLINFGTNVDAANPQEDITPSGVQAYGQSETSIAAAGPYVVEAWNDATGFFAPCPSPMHKEELTGLGFSNDGGKTFKDLGGLPNASCNSSRIEGDPSVEVYQHNGKTYFYITSIFVPFNVPQNFLSLTTCTVVSGGANLSCSNPTVAAVSSDCGMANDVTVCSFLDKEFLAIDPVRGRLYVSYTEFGPLPSSPTFRGQIELAVCDIRTTPGNPQCSNGNSGLVARPYLVIAKGDANCENEGAYPAVNVNNGSLYVAWEFNWTTNFLGPSPCFSEPTQNRTASVEASCLTLPSASCKGPERTVAINIASLDVAFIPGYNRFPANDFPRIAVSPNRGTVSIVWNDTRFHPAADILLQSYDLATLVPVQRSPVRLNSAVGGWHILPALRQANARGDINVSFYGRASGNTALTDVFAALEVDPRKAVSPSTNALITTGPSDWLAVSSDIVPNFGDYTDNYVIAGPVPFVGSTLYVAWSDGRLGDPQPFEDHR